MLDYDGAQFLIIGEEMGEMGKALEEQSRDAKDDDKEKPEEEMEKLEEEVSFLPHLYRKVGLIISGSRSR